MAKRSWGGVAKRSRIFSRNAPTSGRSVTNMCSLRRITFYFQQLHFPHKSNKLMHKFKLHIELEKGQSKSVNLYRFSPILLVTNN